jgi:hypothetical protein
MWYSLFGPIDLFCLVLQAWEAASKAVKDEEAIKQKLCEDLSQLVDVSCLMCMSMVTAWNVIFDTLIFDRFKKAVAYSLIDWGNWKDD